MVEHGEGVSVLNTLSKNTAHTLMSYSFLYLYIFIISLSFVWNSFLTIAVAL